METGVEGASGSATAGRILEENYFLTAKWVFRVK
jgi:hypothetical protein